MGNKTYMKIQSLSLLLILLLGTASLSATPELYENLRQNTPIPEMAIWDLQQQRSDRAESLADSLGYAKQIIRICFAHGRYDLARDYLQTMPEFRQEAGKGNALVVFSHIKQRNYQLAKSSAGNYPEAQSAKAFSQILMGDAQAARESFAHSDTPVSEELLSQAVSPKKPWLAGSLAVIPGLGYAYNGMYQTALSALLMNAAIFASAWELADHDLPIAAVSLSLAGSAFYLGNIWGSMNAANNYNQKARERGIEKYLNSKIYDLLEE